VHLEQGLVHSYWLARDNNQPVRNQSPNCSKKYTRIEYSVLCQLLTRGLGWQLGLFSLVHNPMVATERDSLVLGTSETLNIIIVVGKLRSLPLMNMDP
jgi:hypothetical protein